jgi:hypothetical protein
MKATFRCMAWAPPVVSLLVEAEACSRYAASEHDGRDVLMSKCPRVLWEGFELAEHCPQNRGAGLRALQAEGYADALEEAAQQAETALRF